MSVGRERWGVPELEFALPHYSTCWTAVWKLVFFWLLGIQMVGGCWARVWKSDGKLECAV